MKTDRPHGPPLDAYARIRPGDALPGATLAVTRESIRAFGEATLDFNALHFDDDAAARHGVAGAPPEVIAHGMSTFSLITRMVTDWARPLGAGHRRLETRWRLPARPGDTLRAGAIVKQILETAGGRWVVLDVEVRNQHDQILATGEAMVKFPRPETPPRGSGNGNAQAVRNP